MNLDIIDQTVESVLKNCYQNLLRRLQQIANMHVRYFGQSDFRPIIFYG